MATATQFEKIVRETTRKAIEKAYVPKPSVQIKTEKKPNTSTQKVKKK